MSTVLLGAWLSVAMAGTPFGWRGDGSNAYPEADPPALFAPDTTVAWSTPLPAWGNASPVLIGDLVCVTAEPTTVLCIDRATGKVRWTSTNDYVDTVPAGEQAAVRTKLAEAERLAVSLKEHQRAYSQLQREARRAGTVELSAKLAEASATLDATKRTLDETSAWRTPPNKEVIGYSSPTPVTDGTSLFVLTGNGVVSRFEADGSRTWSRWLGAHTVKMRGYDTGSTASPQLVDGVLVVPYLELMGLDPATGATRWTAGEYTDYGTPGVAEVGSSTVLLTPNGRMLRARDGQVLQEGLGDIWYVGPVVAGRDVYYIGGKSTGHNSGSDGVSASAWRLTHEGGSVRAQRRWSSRLPVKATFYAAPVVHDGLLYAVTNRSTLLAVDTADGAVVYRQDLEDQVEGEAFPSPVIAGRRLYVGATNGYFAVVAPGRTFFQFGLASSGQMRATPVPSGNTLYVRTYEVLYAFQVR